MLTHGHIRVLRGRRMKQSKLNCYYTILTPFVPPRNGKPREVNSNPSRGYCCHQAVDTGQSRRMCGLLLIEFHLLCDSVPLPRSFFKPLAMNAGSDLIGLLPTIRKEKPNLYRPLSLRLSPIDKYWFPSLVGVQDYILTVSTELWLRESSSFLWTLNLPRGS